METDLVLVLHAAAFAAERHRHQRRKDADASPYINHPLALADILAREGGIQDATVIAAALLHDTIEDTETTIDELRACFGERIAAIVAEVTDDKSLPKEQRKRLQITKAAWGSERAKMVKLADKIANLRDMNTSPPADWSKDRRDEYFRWANAVVHGLRGTNAALEAAFEEEYRRGCQLVAPHTKARGNVPEAAPANKSEAITSSKLPEITLPPDSPYSERAEQATEKFHDALLAGKHPNMYNASMNYKPGKSKK